MGKQVLNGVTYGKPRDIKELTQAQYDALSQAEKMNGILYCIKDSGIVEGEQFSPVIYSLEEREIGTWVDGKPVYEKTFLLNSLNIPSATWVSTNILVRSIEKIISGRIVDNGSTGQSFFCTVGTVTLNNLSYIGVFTYYPTGNRYFNYLTIRYTKTTDVPGSGSWGTSGVPTVHYNGNEKIIGTWFGETLYEKTITFGVFPNATSKSVAHNIQNLKFCVDLIASGSDTNGNMLVLPRVVYDSSVLTAQASCYITTTNVVIEAGTDRSSYSGYVTIKYTKSS